MFFMFISDVIGVGSTIFDTAGQLFGDSSGNMPSDQYYPAVKQLTLICPGPFSIPEVAEALKNNPQFVSQIDSYLRQDGAWQPGKYGPLTLEQKASAAVNWAHGGRNCQVTEGEISPQISQTLNQLLSAEAERKRRAALTSPVSGAAEAVSDTLAEQGVSPLQLGLGVVTLFLLLRGS